MTCIQPDDIDGRFVATTRADVSGIELDGEAVLLDESGQLHVLNCTATVIWCCCDGSATVAEISKSLAASFSVSGADIERDVVAAVRDFGRKGLLEGVPGDEQ